MRIILGRAAALAVASAAAFSTSVMPASAADPTYTISGTITLSTGAPADSQVEIDACSADCSTNSAADVAYVNLTNGTGAYSLTVPAGTYALALFGVYLEPGYDEASGAEVPDGYLAQTGSTSQYSILGPDFSDAEKVAVSADTVKNIQLAPAIHNPQNLYTSHTPGTVADKPCAGHATTVSLSPFSDLPGNAVGGYQWYVGAADSLTNAQHPLTPISGATSASYTSTAAQAGQELWVEAWESAPGRIDYDGLGDAGNVAPACSVPVPAPTPAPPTVSVASPGAKHGRAVHGKKVAIVGAKAPGASVVYTWKLNGKAVHTGASYKLPSSAKRKSLTVQVVFSEPGFNPYVETISFGKVK